MKKILILSWLAGAALVFSALFLLLRTSELSPEEQKMVRQVQSSDPSAPTDRTHWKTKPYRDKGHFVIYNERKCWFVYGDKVKLISEKV